MSKYIFVAIWLMFVSTFLLAESNRLIEIEAYSVIIDEKIGVSTYEGDVKFRQGEATIGAQMVELVHNKLNITKITASGNKNKPAYYTQGEKIKAEARRIVYLVEEQIVFLKGKVNIIQGNNSFSGDTFNYDITEDKVIIKQDSDNLERVKLKLEI